MTVTESPPTTRTFLLPDLGEGLTEAEIVRWLVTEGDQVMVDQGIVEVETAKSLVEVPSPYAGVVVTLHGTQGQTLQVGTPLFSVSAGAGGSLVVAPSPSQPSGATMVEQTNREEEQAGSGNVLIGYGTSEPSHSGRRRRPPRASKTSTPSATPTSGAISERKVPLVVSPLVRRLARDGGVELASIEPSGPRGVITRADVVRSLASAQSLDQAPGSPPAAAVRNATGHSTSGERRTPLNGFRKSVGAALSRSRSEIPEATVWVDVDATALLELRENGRTEADPGPGLLAYIARFVVAGLQQYPVLNARLDSESQEIIEYDAVNLGLAVQTERGLVVPAVLGAQTMTTSGLDTAIRDLTDRARLGKVSKEELTGGTFTLNNYGSFNVDGSAAIINHPQVAILGLGRIIDRPWVVDGDIVVRKLTQMSFVFDHRVCDGGVAAGFMRTVADAMEKPASAISKL